MAVREIIEIWSDEGLINENIKFLTKQTKEVDLSRSSNIENIITDLIDTFNHRPCAGIAANQIGYEEKIFIGYNPESNKEGHEIYINPKIEKTDLSSLQEGPEGCLSIPNLTVSITRFDKIDVSYYDENFSFKKITIENFISRLFQHELDHLEGKIMFDRNPRDFSSNSIHENDLEYFFGKYKSTIRSTEKFTCPFLFKKKSFPIFGKSEYRCSATKNNIECGNKKDIFCLSIEYKNCDNYDERLIL